MKPNKSERLYILALNKIANRKKVPPLRAIHLKCLDCMSWQENEVKKCPSRDCILHPFRMGKTPTIKKTSPKRRRKKS